MNNRVLLALLASVVLIISTAVYADTTIGNPAVTKFTEIKGSGEASYTGSGGASIPLYTIKGRSGLDFPLVLSYSPGIKTHQESGPIGLGFSIGAGSVQRGVQGFADDKVAQGSYIPETNLLEEGACVEDTTGRVAGCSTPCSSGQHFVTSCYVSGASSCSAATNKYCRRAACIGDDAGQSYVGACYDYWGENDYSCTDVVTGYANSRMVEIDGDCYRAQPVSCEQGTGVCVVEYSDKRTIKRDGALIERSAGPTVGALTEGYTQDNYFASFPGGAAPLMFYDENGVGNGGVKFAPVNWQSWKIEPNSDFTSAGLASFEITGEDGTRYIFDKVENAEYSGNNYPNVQVMTVSAYTEEDIANSIPDVSNEYTYNYLINQGYESEEACKQACICPYPYTDNAGIYHPTGDAIAVKLESSRVASTIYPELTQYLDNGIETDNYQLKYWKAKQEDYCGWSSGTKIFLASDSRGAAGGVASYCGNGVREAGEECDGSDIGGFTCGGFAPSCDQYTCKINTDECSSCSGSPTQCSYFGYNYGNVKCTGNQPDYSNCVLTQASRLAKSTGVESKRDSHAVSWMLTKIISPDYSDTGDGVLSPDDKGSYVKITYADYGEKIDKTNDVMLFKQKYNNGAYDTFSYNAKDFTNNGLISVQLAINRKSDTLSKSDIDVIQSVETPLYRAEFTYTGEAGRVPQLEYITNRDFTNSQVSKLVFGYASGNSETTRKLKDPDSNTHGERTLLSIKQYGDSSDTVGLPETAFYYGDLGASVNNPDFDIDAKDDKGLSVQNTDAWGYYTARTDLEADENSKAWSLKKITYPTKGTIEYVYESSKYKYAPSGSGQWDTYTTEKLGGGPRVKQVIANYGRQDNSNPLTVTTTFEYIDGVASQKPYHGGDHYQQDTGIEVYDIPWNTVGFVNNYLGYDKVRAITEDSGYTETDYLTPKEVGDENYYQDKNSFYSTAGQQYVGGYLTNNDWKRGVVQGIKSFNSLYQEVSKTEYTYNTIEKVSFTVAGGLYDESGVQHTNFPVYYVKSGWKPLTQEKTTVDNVVITKNYWYNSENGKPNVICEEGNGANKKTIVQYAFENAAYPFMRQRNMLSQPYQTKVFESSTCDNQPTGTLKALTQAEYAEFTPGNPPPPPPVYQCSDTFDNDGDLLIDYPSDPGCSSATDNDETDEPPIYWEYKSDVNLNIPWQTHDAKSSAVGKIGNNKILFLTTAYTTVSYRTYVITDAFNGNIVQDNTYTNGLTGYTNSRHNSLVDINSDGNSELFLINNGDVVAFRWVTNSWVIDSTLINGIDSGPSYYSVSFGDLNCDGLKDMIVTKMDAQSHYYYYVYKNTGTVSSPVWEGNHPELSAGLPDIGASLALNVRFGDVDSDGDDDFVKDWSTNPYPNFYENTAAGSCPKNPQFLFNNNLRYGIGLSMLNEFVLGDFYDMDNDQKEDFFFTNSQSGQGTGIRLWSYRNALGDNLQKSVPQDNIPTTYATAVHVSTEKAWLDSNSNGIVDTSELIGIIFNSYDPFGHIAELTDARGNKQRFFYGSNAACDSSTTLRGGYLTCVQQCLDASCNAYQSAKATYNSDGTTASILDQNEQTTIFGYDKWNRLTSRTLPGNVLAEEYIYHYSTDIASDMNWIKTKSYIDATKTMDIYAYADGLGRDLQTAVKKTTSSSTRANKVFNKLGLVSSQTEPFDAGAAETYDPATPSGTKTANFVYYNDPLGRVKKAYSFGQSPAEPESYTLLQSDSVSISATDTSSDGNCVTSSSYFSASVYPENENYFKFMCAANQDMYATTKIIDTNGNVVYTCKFKDGNIGGIDGQHQKIVYVRLSRGNYNVISCKESSAAGSVVATLYNERYKGPPVHSESSYSGGSLNTHDFYFTRVIDENGVGSVSAIGKFGNVVEIDKNNLVVNPGFEQEIESWNKCTEGGSDCIQTGSACNDVYGNRLGEKCFKAYKGAFDSYQYDVSLKPNSAYIVSFYTIIGPGSYRARLKLTFDDNDYYYNPADGGEYFNCGSVTTYNIWNRVSCMFFAGPNTKRATVTATTGSGGSQDLSNWNLIDNIQIEPATPDGVATSFNQVLNEYDVAGRLLKTTMPNGQAILYTYDTLGRVKTITHPDAGGAKTNYYDAANNLIKVVDARGQSVGYDYDALNRLIYVDFNDDQTGTGEIIYKYDSYTDTNCPVTTGYPNGRLTMLKGAYTSDNGEAVFYKYCNVYSNKGQLTEQDRFIGQDGSSCTEANAYCINFAYNTAGAVSTITYPNNEVVTYNYNEKGQLENAVIPTGQNPLSYVYNADGTLDQVTYPNSVLTEYQYNPRKWVAEVWTHAFSGSGDFKEQNIYDNVGNIVRIEDPIAYASGSFKYDNLYRLTGTYNSISRFYNDFDYTYDTNGNRLSEDNVLYSYDTTRKDRLNSIDVGPGSHTISYTYDNNGNVATEIGSKEFKFCTSVIDPAIGNALQATTDYWLVGVDAPVGSNVDVVYKGTDGNYEWNNVQVQKITSPGNMFSCSLDTTAPEPLKGIQLSGTGGSKPSSDAWYDQNHLDNFKIYPAASNPYYTKTYYYDVENRLVQLNPRSDSECSKFMYDSSGERIEKIEPEKFDLTYETDSGTIFSQVTPTFVAVNVNQDVFVSTQDPHRIYKCNSALTSCSQITLSIQPSHIQGIGIDDKNPDQANTLYVTGDQNNNQKVWSLDATSGQMTVLVDFGSTNEIVYGVDGYKDEAGVQTFYIGVRFPEPNKAIKVYKYRKEGASFVKKAEYTLPDTGTSTNYLGISLGRGRNEEYQNVYATDYTNSRIFRLKNLSTSTTLYEVDRYIGASSGGQQGEDTTWYPFDSDPDEYGYVYVVEHVWNDNGVLKGGNRVFKMDPSMTTKLEVFGQYNTPQDGQDGVANVNSVETFTDSNGVDYVYVADSGTTDFQNRRVIKFAETTKWTKTRYIRANGNVIQEDRYIVSGVSCAAPAMLAPPQQSSSPVTVQKPGQNSIERLGNALGKFVFDFFSTPVLAK